MEITLFRKAVLSWFKKHGRKHLPWQHNPTPYRVWISEIMLQQTQVTTVIPYFDKFIRRFPSINTLAKAHEDEVLHLWTGLGYYSRARNLLKAAKLIATKYKGKFPDNHKDVESLPGIGRSTAAAILAFSMEKRGAILDGNVKRVLSRVSAMKAWENEDKLWALAEKLTPQNNIREYTQAMMDLGATICTRTKPDCLSCPLRTICIAAKENQQDEFPGKITQKVKPVKKTTFLILRNKNNEILLEKRPSKGIWGGLWSLPEYPEEISLKEFCLKQYQCKIGQSKKGIPFRHTFTHFHLDIHPIEIHVTHTPQLKQEHLCWYSTKNPATLGLSAPVKKLLG